MSLFGSNLFTLSCVDIDSILRKVHRELIVMVGTTAASKNQVTAKTAVKNVTDADLANLCKDNYMDARADQATLEKRLKN